MSTNVTRGRRNGSLRNRNAHMNANAKARGLQAVLAEKYTTSGANADLAIDWLDVEGARHEEYRRQYPKAIPGYLYQVEERGYPCVCVKLLTTSGVETEDLVNATAAANVSRNAGVFSDSYNRKGDSYLFMDPRKNSLFTILRGGLGDFVGPHVRGEGSNAAINTAHTQQLLEQARRVYNARPSVESLIDGGDLPFSEVFESNWSELTPQELLTKVDVLENAMVNALSTDRGSATTSTEDIVTIAVTNASKTDQEAMNELREKTTEDSSPTNDEDTILIDAIIRKIKSLKTDASDEGLRETLQMFPEICYDLIRDLLKGMLQDTNAILTKAMASKLATVTTAYELTDASMIDHQEAKVSEEAEAKAQSAMNRVPTMAGGADYPTLYATYTHLKGDMTEEKQIEAAQKYNRHELSGLDASSNEHKRLIAIINRYKRNTSEAPSKIMALVESNLAAMSGKYKYTSHGFTPATYLAATLVGSEASAFNKVAVPKKREFDILSPTSYLYPVNENESTKSISSTMKAIMRIEESASRDLSSLVEPSALARLATAEQDPKILILSKIWEKVNIRLQERINSRSFQDQFANKIEQVISKHSKEFETTIVNAMGELAGELSVGGAGTSLAIATAIVEKGPGALALTKAVADYTGASSLVGGIGTGLGAAGSKIATATGLNRAGSAVTGFFTPTASASPAAANAGKPVNPLAIKGAMITGLAAALVVAAKAGHVHFSAQYKLGDYVIKVAKAYRYAKELATIKATTDRIFNANFTLNDENENATGTGTSAGTSAANANATPKRFHYPEAYGRGKNSPGELGKRIDAYFAKESGRLTADIGALVDAGHVTFLNMNVMDKAASIAQSVVDAQHKVVVSLPTKMVRNAEADRASANSSREATVKSLLRSGIVAQKVEEIMRVVDAGIDLEVAKSYITRKSKPLTADEIISKARSGYDEFKKLSPKSTVTFKQYLTGLSGAALGLDKAEGAASAAAEEEEEEEEELNEARIVLADQLADNEELNPAQKRDVMEMYDNGVASDISIPLIQSGVTAVTMIARLKERILSARTLAAKAGKAIKKDVSLEDVQQYTKSKKTAATLFGKDPLAGAGSASASASTSTVSAPSAPSATSTVAAGSTVAATPPEEPRSPTTSPSGGRRTRRYRRRGRNGNYTRRF